MSAVDPRVEAAVAVLYELGLEGSVEVRGHAGEIASVVLTGRDPEDLEGDLGARLAERIRSLGFRYVALDLAPGTDAG